MAPATANEVLILFSQALSSPAESEQQANILLEVKAAIEAYPAFLPVLYSTILSVAARAGPLLKRWIADVVEFTVARLGVIASPISPEQRAQRKSAGLSLRASLSQVFPLSCTSVSLCVYCPGYAREDGKESWKDWKSVKTPCVF